MKTCKNCIHYKLCEYSVWSDREVKCRDFLSKDIIKEFVDKIKEKKRVSSHYDNGTIYLCKFILIDDIEDIAEEFGVEV